MIPIEIPNVIVEGEICEITDDIRLLRDGMLHIGVEGISIDVSWWPEHDLLGEYVVTAYSLSWEDQIGQWHTNDPQEVVAFVEAAVKHAQGISGKDK